MYGCVFDKVVAAVASWSTTVICQMKFTWCTTYLLNNDDASTYHALTIVLQFKGIDKELYVGLVHTLCIEVITAINMFRDDKCCLYLQKERHNIISILFIETISSISINILHISITYQYLISNPQRTISLHSPTPNGPFTETSLTPH